MAVFLFILVVAGIPVAILLFNDYGKKRGCGRGCATCGNREICYRKQKRKSEKDQ